MSIYFWLSVSFVWGDWRPNVEVGPVIYQGDPAGEYVSLAPCTLTVNEGEVSAETRVEQSILLGMEEERD